MSEYRGKTKSEKSGFYGPLGFRRKEKRACFSVEIFCAMNRFLIDVFPEGIKPVNIKKPEFE